jgi:hypothetical protein
MELYRNYPPQPDIPRPDYLLPSAAAEAKKAQAAEALPGSETTESRSPLAERETKGKVKKNNSPRSYVELAEALPVVPQGRRVVRKRKAHVVEPPGMKLLSCKFVKYQSCCMLTLSVLQSLGFSTRSQISKGD